MITEKNVTYLYVANVTTGLADGASIDLETLPAGSVVVANVSTGLPLAEESAISTTGVYEIINKLSDGTITRSPRFRGSDIVSKGYAAYTPPVEQVSYLGYDGTAIGGLGTIVAGNSYIIGIWLNHTKGMYDLKGEVKHISALAKTTAQADLVKSLMESHLKNFSPIREQYPSILCDRIALTTSVAAITGTATIYKLTKGVKTVSAYVKAAGATSNLTASTASVTAGDVISIPSYSGRSFTFDADVLGATAGRHIVYIGSTSYNVADAGDAAANAAAIAAAINAGTQAAASASTATVTITYHANTVALPPVVLSSADDTTFTSIAVTIASGDAVPVKYKAAATTATAATFELDEPWQGETGYVYEGATEATNIGIATLTSDTWGLKFMGVAQPFNPIADSPAQVNFDVLTDSFGDYGNEYKAVKPSAGNGTYAQVAELETYAQFNEKWTSNSTYPPAEYKKEALSGNTYNMASVVVKPTISIASTGTVMANPFTLVLAVKVGLTAPAIATIFG